MKKIQWILTKLAGPCAAMLSAVLMIAANTNSCAMIHQPKAPANLSRYSRVH